MLGQENEKISLTVPAIPFAEPHRIVVANLARQKNCATDHSRRPRRLRGREKQPTPPQNPATTLLPTAVWGEVHQGMAAAPVLRGWRRTKPGHHAVGRPIPWGCATGVAALAWRMHANVRTEHSAGLMWAPTPPANTRTPTSLRWHLNGVPTATVKRWYA